ncbi:hypothetical protein [Litorihabitans aurantiacus]|uniref:Uncharacterized protein n=1 Tax=Litorihabitans aurantiacus TaxID=1930061 RepID=A0AA37XHX2_9MICO|nr:hypothetical protein [Litorihabitans aurantiacus]GMA33232.1 hypothetical protein GCM10025875_32240 [Litorihabitans aurantiacus]
MRPAPTPAELEDAPGAPFAPDEAQLDTPLVAALDLAPLTVVPTRRRIAQVRDAAFAGRYGRGGPLGDERREAAPQTIALGVAVAVAAIPAVLTVVLAVRDGGDAVLVNVALTLGLGLVAGALTYPAVAAGVRRRWRRRARLADVAKLSGLRLRLAPHPEVLPAVVRADDRLVDYTIQQGDVLSGRVRGHLLMVGLRSGHQMVNTRTQQVDHVWVALRRRAEEEPGVAVDVQDLSALERWCAADARPRPVHLVVDDEWIALGVDSPFGDLGVLADLVSGTDVALAAVESRERER